MKEFIMMIYSLTPSDFNFHTIWTSKVISANYFVRKRWSAGTIIMLSYWDNGGT